MSADTPLGGRGAELFITLYYLFIHTDTYVKIKVISSKGKRIGRSKTTTRRNNSDPEYNETFVYTMSVADLKDATMMFTLYGKDTYSLIFNLFLGVRTSQKSNDNSRST